MAEPEVKSIKQLFVEVSSDGMVATLHIPKMDRALEEKEIRDALAKADVVYGVNDSILQWLLKAPVAANSIVIANGLPPKQGKSGWIEYKFDAEKAREFGSSKHEHKYTFQNVEENALLAIKHPVVTGEPGRNVKGNRVEPNPIKDINFGLGENTTFSTDNEYELIATRPGCVTMDEMGKIAVHDHISLMCDIDNAVGDFEYYGDMFVRGDVKSGFSIKTRGKLQVHGTIEDATIEANEVEITGGFVGSGTGVCHVGKEFRSQFVINEEVRSDFDIYVSGEVRNSILYAGNAIFITGNKGVVLGGRIEAIHRIEATTLGNNIDITCHLTVGRPPELIAQLEAAEQHLKSIKERLMTMKVQYGLPADFDVIEDNTVRQKNTPMSRGIDLLKKVVVKQLEAEQDCIRISDEIDRIAAESAIQVYRICHTGVVLKIGNVERTIEQPIERSIFRLQGGAIVAEKNA